ncbi:DUF732 domain-containing protein [Pseudonocardia sichuanensis]
MRLAAAFPVLLAAAACSSAPEPSVAVSAGPAASAASVPASGCGPDYPRYDDTGVTAAGRPYVTVLRRECVPLAMPELISAGLAGCRDLQTGGDLATARAAVGQAYPGLTSLHAAAIVGSAQAVMCPETLR